MIESDKSFLSHNGEQDFEASCDSCGKMENIDGAFWGDMIDELKSNGWVIYRYDEKWMHFCSKECYRKWLKKRKTS